MKKLYFSLLIIGCAVFNNCKAQDSLYWSVLGVYPPAPESGGGQINCMSNDAVGGDAYQLLVAGEMSTYSGNLYVAGFDAGNPYNPWDFYVLDSFNFNSGDWYFGINAICQDANYNFYIAGDFHDATGYNVYKYDRALGTYAKLGNLNANAQIWCLCTDINGNIYAAGDFTNGVNDTTGKYYVAKWNGSTWSELGAGGGALNAPATISSICADPVQPIIYAAVSYSNGSNSDYVAEWNGSAWSVLPGQQQFGNNIPYICAPRQNSLLAVVNVDSYAGVGYWNGSQWSFTGLPPEAGSVSGSSVCVTSDNTVYLAGAAGGSNGTLNGFVYKSTWGNNDWVPVGTNNFALHANGSVTCICPPPAYSNSVVVAGGRFTQTDVLGYPYYYVASYGPLNPTDLYVYMQPTPVNCNEGGSITTTVFGGTPPYQYQWSNGANTDSVNQLNSGTYYVTVTDANGQVAMGDVFVPTGCYAIIRGIIYSDVNVNCVFDSGDLTFGGRTIQVLSGNGQTYYGYAQPDGSYSVAVGDTGNCYITIHNGLYQCNYIETCPANSDTLYIPYLGDTLNNINFAVYQASGNFDLTLLPNWNIAYPGGEKDYYILPYNALPSVYTGPVTVIFNYDSNLIYLGSTAPYFPVVDTVAHTLTWSFSNYTVPYPIYNFTMVLWAKFMVPSNLSLSYQLQSTFTILPDSGDCNIYNNSVYFSQTVIGSHDPNYKEVSPHGEVTANDSVFTYTIHFQNNGNDSTHFVVVIDTLSPYLNPATVINLAGSNIYSNFTISGQGILTWTFDSLQLPDSADDPAGSTGFIMFSVQKKPNLPFGADISNAASIYFDYNQPIVTNIATDTFICSYYTNLEAGICPSQTYNFNGHLISVAGTYTDTLFSNQHCDSIITLTLSVYNSIPPTYIYDTICTGSSFFFNSQNLTQPGTYYDTLSGAHSCDSIIILNLFTTAADTINQYGGLCGGDSIYFFGRYIYTPGYYDTILPSQTGCDTFATLSLAVIDPLPPTQIYDTICQGNSVAFNGSFADTTGIYTAHYSPQNGCDSTVVLHLTVTPVPVVTFSWDSLVAGGQLSPYYPPDTLWCFYLNTTLSLAGGTPPGGTYTGTAVSGNILYGDSFSTNVLFDTITYTFSLNGCGASASEILQMASFCDGIIPISADNLFTLYPNPTKDYVIIETDESATGGTIRITDVTGREIAKLQVTGYRLQVNTNGFAAGVYFVTLNDRSGRSATRKLVIQ